MHCRAGARGHRQNDLNNAGVVVGNGGQATVVAQAHKVCDALNAGIAPPHTDNSDPSAADTFVQLAIQYYCPGAHLPKNSGGASPSYAPNVVTSNTPYQGGPHGQG